MIKMVNSKYIHENTWKSSKNKDCCKDKAQDLLQKIHQEEFAIDRHPNHVCKGFDEGQNNAFQLMKQWISEDFNIKASNISNFNFSSISNQISDKNYSRLCQIPEDIIDVDDAINFLITHYYKHQELSKAQEILSSEEGLQ